MGGGETSSLREQRAGGQIQGLGGSSRQREVWKRNAGGSGSSLGTFIYYRGEEL